MSLIVFAFAFVFVSYVIIRLAFFVLENEKNSSYITMYIKGTVRGSMGLFESSSMLEAKREKLRRKNSKF